MAAIALISFMPRVKGGASTNALSRDGNGVFPLNLWQTMETEEDRAVIDKGTSSHVT